MEIMNIVSIISLVVLVIGFFIGFFRSFKKSLARFLMIAVSLAVAIIVSPILSNYLVKTFVTGYELNAFGFSINFEELLGDIISSNSALSDLMSATATENLVSSIMNLVINIAAFFAIYFVLFIITLIIFWIFNFISFLVNRKNPNYEIKKENRKKISYRLTGGIFGTLTALLFCFVISIPVFGVMNICNQFLEEPTIEAASAIDSNNLVSGNLFYTEDETIGSVEGYIQQYAQIKDTIDNSILGKITNTLGISKLSKQTFEYLTTVEQGGLEVSLTNEVVSVIKVYNAYKEGFIENQLDTENKESVYRALDSIELIYKEANNSTIVKSYLVELIPKFREKWLVGESYLGIKFPVDGDYKDLVLIIIDKGFDTYNITEINNNVYSLINVLRAANEAGVIKAINDNEDIVEFLKQDESNLIKKVIVELSNSKFKNALPNVIENVVKIAYDLVIDTDNILSKEEIENIFAEVDKSLPETIDWNVEGECLQNLILSALNISDVFYSSESTTDSIINNLNKFGIVIDNARNSIFSNHFKILVVEMIDNKIDTDILGGDAMNILKAKLKSNWSSSDFKFESMFETLKQTALLAQKITIDSGTLTSGNLDEIMGDLENVVADLISNQQVKETFVSIIENDVLEQLIPEEHSDTINVVKDMVNSFMNETTADTIKTDIAAGKEIINIVNTSVNNGTFSLVDETLTKEQKAQEIVETITNSDAIMTVVGIAISDGENSNSLQTMTQNLSGEDIEILKSAINSFDTESEDAEKQSKNEANKAALMLLFGITA